MFTISHFVQLDVLLDVFCELYGVSGFSHTQQQDLLAQLEHLVIIWSGNITGNLNIMKRSWTSRCCTRVCLTLQGISGLKVSCIDISS